MSKRSRLDQYYTDEEYAKKCYEIAKPWMTEYLFEPCVGTGSFYHLMKENKRGGIDLDPKVEGIPTMNFFDFKEPLSGVSVLSNPPFGFACSLAIGFFNHCADLGAESIAFIIPKTFRKASVSNKLDQYYYLVLDETTPKNSFILDGEPYDVPCCFQVWVRSDDKRALIDTTITCEDFIFCNKKEADIAMRRVGGNAGKVLEGTDHTESSTYFLKILNIKGDVASKLEGLDLSYERDNTVGVKSVAKHEIIKKYLKGV